jgi:sulfonate transport system substrate-binding protein
MVSFNIGGVPEHFNLPWRLAIEEKLFEKENINLHWQDYPGGTGATNKALRDKELDLCICLTEGITADIVVGNPVKIIKTYVESPLTWGMYVAQNSSFENLQQLENKDDVKNRFAISRFGSGSYLMAYVKAKDLGWDTQKLQFVALANLDGMISGLQNADAEVFMWEKVMTQPRVQSGELRYIGECVTPWSCFMLVGRVEILEKYPSEILKICEIINQFCKNFKQIPQIIEILTKRYQINEEHTKKWLQETEWATDMSVSEQMLAKVVQTLFELKIINKNLNINELRELYWKC